MKEPIFLNGDNDTQKLKGKVIEGVSFYVLHGSPLENHLIITFTDNTYIMIEMKEDYKGDYDYVLRSVQAYKPRISNNDLYLYQRNERYPEFLQRQLDLGVLDEETLGIRKAVEEWEEAKEKHEYKEYLRLKEKYEGKSK